MPKEQINITIPLDSLIWCILGDHEDGLLNARIPPEIALVIQSKLPKDRQTHIVVFTNDDGQPYDYPILWRYNAYQQSNELLDKRRKWDEKRRVEDWIRDANVNNLAQAIVKSTGMLMKDAQNTAYKLVKNGNVEMLKVMGLEHLITTKEELE